MLQIPSHVEHFVSSSSNQALSSINKLTVIPSATVFCASTRWAVGILSLKYEVVFELD